MPYTQAMKGKVKIPPASSQVCLRVSTQHSPAGAAVFAFEQICSSTKQICRFPKQIFSTAEQISLAVEQIWLAVGKTSFTAMQICYRRRWVHKCSCQTCAS